MVDTNLPKSNVLVVVAFALMTSIVCTWVIATHFQVHNQVQFDRLYNRIIAIEKVVEKD